MNNIIISNFINERFIDRIYMNFNKTLKLINKNGSTYTGQIKTIKKNGFKFYMSEDKRFFNNSGLPIDKPNFINDDEELKKFKDEIKKDMEEKKFKELKKRLIKNV